MRMPRRTKTNNTRNREIDDLSEMEFDTFAQQMDYLHIPCSGRTSSGRRTWRVMSGSRI